MKKDYFRSLLVLPLRKCSAWISVPHFYHFLVFTAVLDISRLLVIQLIGSNAWLRACCLGQMPSLPGIEGYESHCGTQWQDDIDDTQCSGWLIWINGYWAVRDELSIDDGLIPKGSRLVIPPSMRQNMLQRTRAAHQGMVKSKQKARQSLYWHGMSTQIEELVKHCSKYEKYQPKQRDEPIIATETPQYPWSVLGSDLYEWRNKHYLLTVDYHTRYIEVDKASQSVSKAHSASFEEATLSSWLPRNYSNR